MKLFFKSLIFIIAVSSAVSAQIPKTMSYQGVLADTSGNSVVDGNYNLTFRIYNIASGGTEIWTETQTIPVVDGIFNAILGSVTPLNLAFDQPYWLGVSVEGGIELSPRIELTSVPYSLEPDSGSAASSLQINDLSDAKYIGHSLFLGSGSGDNDDGTDNYNTAVGYIALQHNTSGYINTALGGYALHNNTSGFGNTAAGYEALADNLTGNKNTAVGFLALTHNKADSNSAFGYAALLSNTTGYENTAMGYQALLSNTIGIENSAMGYDALRNNTTGRFNQAIGQGALDFNTSGEDNTAIGLVALFVNKTGNGNTAIGNFSGPQNTSLSGLNNTTAIGFDADVFADNQVRIGNSDVTSIGGYAPWSNLSDARFKRNVKENVSGLDFILGLRPVTFTFDMNAISNKLEENITYDKNGNKKHIEESPEMIQSREKKSKKRRVGFIAQEVESLVNKLGIDFDGVEKPENEDDFYRLRYSEFVVPLVKAVQEQQALIEKQQEENEKQQQEIERQQEEINQLRSEINH